LLSYPIVMTWAFSLALAGGDKDPLEPLGRLSDRSIRETSGIVKSRKYRDVFWIQSDSGNPSVIHAIRRDGHVLASFRVAAANVDWEDIATDDAGHLYLGDTGNNGELLPLRAVYKIDEPDPFKPSKVEIPVTLTVAYRFPSKAERFDAESLFVAGGSAFLIAKRHDRREAEVFALPVDRSASLLRPILPRQVGIIPNFKDPATGASLSADGRILAVVSNRATRIYDRAADGGLTLRATVRYKERDIEAIAWDGLDLILATEAGELFRLAAKTWTQP
jgi:hypothetical protein